MASNKQSNSGCATFIVAILGLGLLALTWPLGLAVLVSGLIFRSWREQQKAAVPAVTGDNGELVRQFVGTKLGAVALTLLLVGVAGEVPWAIHLAHNNSDTSSAASSDGTSSDAPSVASYSGSTSGDSGHVSSSQLTAFEMCKDFVKQRLKAPSGATWRDPIGDQVTYSGSGSGPITVDASVDSQNGFGAKLRSTYSCTVTNTGGDNWRLNNLQFNDGGDSGTP